MRRSSGDKLVCDRFSRIVITTGGVTNSVGLLRWNDTSHSTTRIGNIISVARDEMKMDVEDCLAGGLADVHSEIEAVGRMLAYQQPPRRSGQIEDCLVLHGLHLEPVGDMSSRNEHQVSRRYRMAIVHGVGKLFAMTTLAGLQNGQFSAMPSLPCRAIKQTPAT